ncbi:MAG: xylulokinase, partial [Alphaproteobacteria bacterium]
VAAGGGDNAAGAVGAGVIATGQAFLSLGTSGVLFVADDACQPNPARAVHTFCHCLPGRWHRMAVLLSAASCVDWVARATGMGDAAALFERLENGEDPAIESLVFLPYLSGERTPHNDPHAKGVFFGLTHRTGPAALAQAVLEGVAYAFADGLDALAETGASIDSISVIGGGARTAYWGGILSAVLERTLIYRQGAEAGPAYGAARLARLAISGEAPEDICTPPPVRAIIEPDERRAARYRVRRPLFQALYQTLQPLFPEQSHDP